MAKKQIEIIKKIEAEARKIKPKVLSSKRSAFLNKARGSGDCYVYYGQDYGAWLNKNPPYGSSIVQIATAGDKNALLTNNGITGVFSNGTSAKYGNKAYEFFHHPSNIIVEFIIDPVNDTLSFGQAYTPPASYSSSGGAVTAACAKDSNTILIARSNLTEIIEINLQPAGTYTYNTLFTIASNISGGTDMVYRPSDNTIFVVVSGASNPEVHQYSYNGTLLDSVSISSFNFPNMMFCHGGKIFIHDVGYPDGDVYEIETNPLSLLPSTISYIQPGNAGDAASSPECCDGGGATSTECYDIGDTGPEGGTIFAVPLGHPQNNGVNQTNFYYEVANNDIAIGGTPNAGFNLTCGSPLVSTQTPVMVSAGLLNPGNLSFSFSWGPSNFVSIGGVQVPWNQSFNYIDYTGWEVSGVDDNGNQLWAPGTTITSSSYPQLIPPSGGSYMFVGNASTPSLGTLTTSLSSTIKLTPPITPPSPSSWSASGAEWGVHNKPNIVTSTDFGTGHKNTDTIDAYPLSPGNPTGGIHPWLDSHDIAATLCKQTEGYFLPSYQEFRQMVDASVAYGFNLALNTSTQSSENYYWTSSHRLPPSAALPDPHKYAWAYNTDTDNLELAYRCHALSVRPIRRFECEPEPPFVDKGIDYDYRIDTSGNNSVGTIDSMYNPYSAAGDISVMYHTGESYMFSALNSSYSAGSVNIGANSIAIMFNRSLTHSVDPAALPSLIQPNGLLPDVGDPIFNILTPDPITGGPPYQLSLGPISQVILDTDPQWASTFQNINTPASAGGFFGAGAGGVYQWSDPANNTYNYSNHEPFDHSIIIDTILVFDAPLPGGKGAQQSPQNQTGYDPTTNPITLWTYDTGSGSHMNFQYYPPGTRFGEGSPNLNHGLRFETSVPNNLYSPNVFSGYEIGHDYLKFVDWNRFDVRYNDLHGLSNYPDRLDGYANEIFSIKIYDQYEELLGDWDYKLKDRHGGKGCCVNHCHHIVVWEKVQTNYVNPLHSSHPDVVDLSVYHEGLAQAGHPEGWAYVSITCKTDLTWNSGMTRGNTLNLEDWRGTGQNNRTKDNTYPISGIQWKWQKEVCGDHSSTNTCCSVLCGRYKAELNPPSLNIYCHSFNTATPNHTVLFNTKQDCTSGGVSVINSTQAKLINPSENYSDEINQCFEDGETEVDVYIFSQAKHDENISKRQKFINDKKPKETGPFGIAGYYPLYDTIEAATYNSPTPIESRSGEKTYGYHIHDFGGQEYYMPNGLEMGITQFHGDYDGQVIPETTARPETIQPEEQVIQPEQPSVVTITPKPLEPLVPPPSTPTYTPPPSTSSGESEGGGY